MSKSIYHIPCGPKNLATIFNTVDFNLVTDYYLQVQDASNNVLATTPGYKSNCCCPDDKIRLHFLNSVGGWDALNFLKPSVVHEDTADQFQNSLNYPLSKTDTGIERFNVNSNDTWEARSNLKEEDMPWVRELADSPKILLEWTGIEGQADDYIPVVKIAGKFPKLKNDQEFQYQFVIQFMFSNAYMTIRN